MFKSFLILTVTTVLCRFGAKLGFSRVKMAQ